MLPEVSLSSSDSKEEELVLALANEGRSLLLLKLVAASSSKEDEEVDRSVLTYKLDHLRVENKEITRLHAWEKENNTW